MYSTSTLTAPPTEQRMSADLVDALATARRLLRDPSTPNRAQLRHLVSEIEDTYEPGPVELGILNARTDADLLAVTR